MLSRPTRAISATLRLAATARRALHTPFPSTRARNVQSRHYATPPPQVNQSSLSMDQYHHLSDVAMDNILQSLEDVVDSINDDGYEVEYSSGVLTLRLGPRGTYVINKQPPNKQIWLSSPFSGPKRYDYCPDRLGWYCKRDGQLLHELLRQELSAALKADITIWSGNEGR